MPSDRITAMLRNLHIQIKSNLYVFQRICLYRRVPRSHSFICNFKSTSIGRILIALIKGNWLNIKQMAGMKFTDRRRGYCSGGIRRVDIYSREKSFSKKEQR